LAKLTALTTGQSRAGRRLATIQQVSLKYRNVTSLSLRHPLLLLSLTLVAVSARLGLLLGFVEHPRVWWQTDRIRSGDPDTRPADSALLLQHMVVRT
jgi:hypothetical protein